MKINKITEINDGVLTQRISAAVVHADAAHIRAMIKCKLAAQHKSANGPSNPVALHA